MEVENNSQPEAVQTDAFGEAIPQPPKEGEEAVVKDAEIVKDDSKLTPTERMTKMAEELGTLKATVASSEALHKTKDENIRALVEKIKKFEAGTGNDKGGKEQEGDVPFKEIKTSKDLTDEEKDEMTDAEIKALDESALLKQTINKMSLDLAEAKKGGASEAVDVNKTVKETALELAGDDADVANKIIEAFNGMKFNTEGLTAEEIAERVGVVAGTVKGYTPPKEGRSTIGHGKVVKKGTQSDPHGVDKIVEEVAEKKTGGTYQL